MTSFYSAYIKSKKWDDFRKKAIVNAGRKCEMCGSKNKLLQVHHKHYRTIGAESFNDVEVLCLSCHRTADHDREYSDALETYANKKFGENWDYTNDDLDRAERSFDEWVERKQFEEYGY